MKKTLPVLLFLLLSFVLPPTDAKAFDTVRDVYNWTSYQGLSLEDLKWQETGRKILPSGVTVIRGTWEAGSYTGYNALDEILTVPLREVAMIYLPPGVGLKSGIPVLLGGDHEEAEALTFNPRYEWLALNMGGAVMRHGQADSVCRAFLLKDRNAMLSKSLEIIMDLNPCELKRPYTGNFFLSLARTNVLALTLLERIVGQEGGTMGGAAVDGYSKEGYAVWLMSAVDSRVKIANPGGFQNEDFVGGVGMMEANQGCDNISGSYEDSLSDSLLQYRFRNWLAESPAGREWNRLFSVSSFKHLLYPSSFIINGDVGAYGMHDGLFFSPGAETGFLDGLTERSWRYYRRTPDYLPDNRTEALLWGLTHGANLDFVPKITETKAFVSGLNTFRIGAVISPDAVSARLWYSHSDDRAFNDEDNAAWESVPMTNAEGYWLSPWITVPVGHQAAWYVETEGRLSTPMLETETVDASPIRFLFELPALSCRVESPDCKSVPPAVPRLVSPMGSIPDAQPVFAWKESAGALEYLVSVPGVGERRVSSGACSNGLCSALSPVLFNSGTSLTWQVKAINEAGESEWSAPGVFRVIVNTVPAAPLPVAPSGDIYTRIPTVIWYESPGASQYQIYLKDVGSLWFPSSVCLNGLCTAASPVSLSPGGYTWQVRASNQIGESAWSRLLTFTVH